VESAISVQKLKPTIDAIKRQYGEDKDKIQRETSALYEKAGVNPLAGWTPPPLPSNRFRFPRAPHNAVG